MNKTLKYLSLKIVIFLSIITKAFWATEDVWDKTILNWITWSVGWSVEFVDNIGGENGISILSSLFVWFKWELFSVVMVFAIAVFIFIGIRLASARWNPEEFKKAMTHFVYSIVWIFFVFMAWWLVKLVASLSL
jgi:hypothetical protein